MAELDKAQSDNSEQEGRSGGSGLAKSDLFALIVAALLGAPFVFMLASAFADGELRRHQAAARSLIGDEAYNALMEGDSSPQHYVGNNRTAPDFELPMEDGRTFRLSDHRGKVVVLNFWTTTCQPCMEEMPSLIQLSRALEGRDDIELVTISVDTDWETAHTAVPASSSLTVLLDSDRSVVNGQFGSRLFPETWVVDADGIIRLRVDGQRDWSSPLALDAFESFL